MPPRKPATRKWSSLGSASQRRYERAAVKLGIPDVVKHYESGGSLKALRGHAKTPEKPKEAERYPEKYREYLARGSTRTKPLWAHTTKGIRYVRGLAVSERKTVQKHAVLIGRFLEGSISQSEFTQGLRDIHPLTFIAYVSESSSAPGVLSGFTLAVSAKRIRAERYRGKKFVLYDEGESA